MYIAAFFGSGTFEGLWLPENSNSFAWTIDHLFELVHVLCGIVLGLTTSVLAWIIWRFSDRPGRTAKDVQFTTHNNMLEIAWTVVPAAILIFLCFYQYKSWDENKMTRPLDGQGHPTKPMARVVAKQFGWEIYYPGEDLVLGTADDLKVENELIVPVDQPVVLELESLDVIHSFAIPGLRVKQDVVPGMVQPIWFQINRKGTFELICMELCGWGHYKMRGRIQAVASESLEQAIQQSIDRTK